MKKQTILKSLEMRHAQETKRLQGIALHPFMTPGKRHLATQKCQAQIRQLERQMSEITRL